MNSLEELTPDHTVSIGDESRKNGYGSGDKGDHDNAVVTVVDRGEAHTFRTDITIERGEHGDVVELKDVPRGVSPVSEVMGPSVELDGDHIARGAYRWFKCTDKGGEDRRVAKLYQTIICAICDTPLHKDVKSTVLGSVCRQCAWAIENSDNEEGDR